MILLIIGPCGYDAALFNEQHRIRDQAEVKQFRSNARTLRSSKRGKLTDIDDSCFHDSVGEASKTDIENHVNLAPF